MSSDGIKSISFRFATVVCIIQTLEKADFSLCSRTKTGSGEDIHFCFQNGRANVI